MNSSPRMQHLTDHWLLGKIGSWVRRYLPAEIAGTTAALFGITVALQLEQNIVTTALIGAWSEIAGFYAAMIVHEWRAHQRARRPSPMATLPLTAGRGGKLTIVAAFLITVRQTIGFLSRLLRNLVLEFGAAELLDPFILRPALLTLAMRLIPELPLALMVGKFSADLVFYTVTIGSLELRRKRLTT